MRKQIKTTLEGIHMLLLFNMLLPAFYMLRTVQEEGMVYRLYVAGYLLIVAVSGVRKAAVCCKTLWQYLLIVAVFVGGLSILARRIGVFFLSGTENIYVLYIVAGTLIIGVEAYLSRMDAIRLKKAKEQNDSSYKQREVVLEKPKLFLVFVFVVIYVLALLVNSPEVCNLALVSAMAYLLTAVAHDYISEMEAYLSINDSACNVRNIPYKKIFGIGKYFLFSYMGIILLALIPALLTINYRNYHDYEEKSRKSEVVYEEIVQTEEMQEEGIGFAELMQQTYGPPKETPIWVNILFYAGLMLFVLVLLIAFVKWMKKEFAAFSQGVDEAGDFVEDLSPEESVILGERFWRSGIKENPIRREYRRFIKRHRKEHPEPYETPREIEILAGVADTTAGKEIHERYEQVRYGRPKKEKN